jgi:transposase
VKLLRQIPSIGPIQATLLVAWLQTPQRFRSKRQLWAYSGFAVETHDSGEYRCVRGKLVVVGGVLEMLGSRGVSVNEIRPRVLWHRVTHFTVCPLG